jgi:hypothetical protein
MGIYRGIPEIEMEKDSFILRNPSFLHHCSGERFAWVFRDGQHCLFETALFSSHAGGTWVVVAVSFHRYFWGWLVLVVSHLTWSFGEFGQDVQVMESLESLICLDQMLGLFSSFLFFLFWIQDDVGRACALIHVVFLGLEWR